MLTGCSINDSPRERFRQREDLAHFRAPQRRRPVRRAGERKRPAKAAHLTQGRRALRMRFEARMPHIRSPPAALRASGANRQCVRFCSSIRKARVLTPRSTGKLSCGPAQEPVAFCRSRSSPPAPRGGNDGPAKPRPMAVDVLLRRMHDDVDAQFERPLKVMAKGKCCRQMAIAPKRCVKSATRQVHQIISGLVAIRSIRQRRRAPVRPLRFGQVARST